MTADAVRAAKVTAMLVIKRCRNALRNAAAGHLDEAGTEHVLGGMPLRPLGLGPVLNIGTSGRVYIAPARAHRDGFRLNAATADSQLPLEEGSPCVRDAATPRLASGALPPLARRSRPWAAAGRVYPAGKPVSIRLRCPHDDLAVDHNCRGGDPPGTGITAEPGVARSCAKGESRQPARSARVNTVASSATRSRAAISRPRNVRKSG